MSDKKENCDVGFHTNTECHLTHYSSNKLLHKLQSLSIEEISLLKYRIEGFHEISEGTICDHHAKIYLTLFTSLKRKCCNPFAKHKKKVVDNLRILKIELCEKALTSILLKIISGDKICHNCEIILNDKINLATKNSGDSGLVTLPDNSDEVNLRRSERILKVKPTASADSDVNAESQNSISSTVESINSNFSDFFTLSQEKRVVDTVLSNLQLPNLKKYQFYKIKRVHDAQNIVQDVCKNFRQLLTKATNSNIFVPERVSKNIMEDSCILRDVLFNLQRKFIANHSVYEKLEILALLPKTWIKHKISQFFECNNYLYMKLHQFRESEGELSKLVCE